MSFTHIPVVIPILALKNEVFLKTCGFLSFYFMYENGGYGQLCPQPPELTASAAVRHGPKHPVLRVHRRSPPSTFQYIKPVKVQPLSLWLIGKK